MNRRIWAGVQPPLPGSPITGPGAPSMARSDRRGGHGAMDDHFVRLGSLSDLRSAESGESAAMAPSPTSTGIATRVAGGLDGTASNAIAGSVDGRSASGAASGAG